MSTLACDTLVTIAVLPFQPMLAVDRISTVSPLCRGNLLRESTGGATGLGLGGFGCWCSVIDNTWSNCRFWLRCFAMTESSSFCCSSSREASFVVMLSMSSVGMCVLTDAISNSRSFSNLN